MIEYKRGRKHETDVSEWMTWESRCGTYRVQECIPKYGRRKRYYALVNDGERFVMLEHMKTYKTRLAAERAVKQHMKGK
jgi:hypothetical protein